MAIASLAPLCRSFNFFINDGPLAFKTYWSTLLASASDESDCNVDLPSLDGVDKHWHTVFRLDYNSQYTGTHFEMCNNADLIAIDTDYPHT